MKWWQVALMLLAIVSFITAIAWAAIDAANDLELKTQSMVYGVECVQELIDETYPPNIRQEIQELMKQSLEFEYNLKLFLTQKGVVE